MNRIRIITHLCLLIALLHFCSAARAENIDPDSFAYGQNVGWLNFDPNKGSGVTVTGDKLSGFVWAQNIGWVNLDPNDTDPNSGIKNDGTGLLTGFAWGQNVGWINFNPKVPADSNHYGVTIDDLGKFNGWAWGENIGWIHFQSAAPVAYLVKTTWITSCIVDYDDLGLFCDQWLDTGLGLKADLNYSGNVNFLDYRILAGCWLGHCPPGWPLKE